MSGDKLRFLGLLWAVWGVLPLVHGATLPALSLVDQEGSPVEGAVVVLEGGDPGDAADVEDAPPDAVMEQVDIAFEPRVIAVSPGTRVRFPNRDDTRHHVYSFSQAKTFELQLHRGNEAPPVEFDQAGLVVVGCNIHDSMRGYIYVVDSRIHGVTDADGQVTLPAFNDRNSPRLTFRHPDMREALSLNVTDVLDSGGDILRIRLPMTLSTSEPEPKASDLRNRLQRYQNDGD